MRVPPELRRDRLHDEAKVQVVEVRPEGLWRDVWKHRGELGEGRGGGGGEEEGVEPVEPRGGVGGLVIMEAIPKH